MVTGSGPGQIAGLLHARAHESGDFAGRSRADAAAELT